MLLPESSSGPPIQPEGPILPEPTTRGSLRVLDRTRRPRTNLVVGSRLVEPEEKEERRNDLHTCAHAPRRSEWNKKNLFTGWVDVPLSEKGVEEAKAGGVMLKEAGVLPDLLFTSMQKRAIKTANLALDTADRSWIPVQRRGGSYQCHYGTLQGLDKAATREKYGDEQFMLWRRSYDTPPPAIDPGSEFAQDGDPRYAGDLISAHRMPQGRPRAHVALLG